MDVKVQGSVSHPRTFSPEGRPLHSPTRYCRSARVDTCRARHQDSADSLEQDKGLPTSLAGNETRAVSALSQLVGPFSQFAGSVLFNCLPTKPPVNNKRPQTAEKLREGNPLPKACQYHLYIESHCDDKLRLSCDNPPDCSDGGSLPSPSSLFRCKTQCRPQQLKCLFGCDSVLSLAQHRHMAEPRGNDLGSSSYARRLPFFALGTYRHSA